MNLLRLPTEIIVEILLPLDVADAYAIQALNHFFRDLYKTSPILQYTLECKIAHVHDNPNCHLSITERLQMLRDRETAWNLWTPTSKRILKDLARRTYLELQPHHCMLYGHLNVGTLIQRTFKISPIRGIERSSLRSILVEDMVHAGYCIDEHDLIACLRRRVKGHLCEATILMAVCHRIILPGSHNELRLVLLQYSTGNAHPLAMEPDILVSRDVSSDMNRRFGPVRIQIFGETLVLTLSTRVHRGFGWMYIYNWKSGKAKWEPIRIVNIDIVVLNHNLVIVPDREDWSLGIFYIPSSSSGSSVKLIQRLKLPPYKQSSDVSIRCQSLPNPTGDGRFPEYVSSSIPFMDRPDTALICFGLPGLTSMVVHRHSIMKLLPPPEDWAAIMEPQILDWDYWGPPATAIELGWMVTYGQRSVYLSPSGMVCYDFNMYHVRRSANVEQPDPCKPYPHEESVSTRLPCIEVVSSLENDVHVHIADGVVIRMKDDDDDTIEVLYFGH